MPSPWRPELAGRVEELEITSTLLAGNPLGDPAVRPLLDAEGKLTIEGALKYQACDDRICYPPETVPVRWTLQVEGHDRERAPAELQRKAN